MAKKTETEIETDITRLLGKRIHRILGIPTDRRSNTVTARYIMFDDRETYVVLDEQDYYAYHDCSYSARLIDVRKDKKDWARLDTDTALQDSTTLT